MMGVSLSLSQMSITLSALILCPALITCNCPGLSSLRRTSSSKYNLSAACALQQTTLAVARRAHRTDCPFILHHPHTEHIYTKTGAPPSRAHKDTQEFLLPHPPPFSSIASPPVPYAPATLCFLALTSKSTTDLCLPCQYTVFKPSASGFNALLGALGSKYTSSTCSCSRSPLLPHESYIVTRRNVGRYFCPFTKASTASTKRSGNSSCGTWPHPSSSSSCTRASPSTHGHTHGERE